MMRNSEVLRYFFLVIAIAMLTLSPVFLLTAPLFVANTLYHRVGTWYVFVSGTSYGVYAVGYLFLFLAAVIIFILNIKKSSIGIGVICVILSAISFVFASQEHTSLADDSISYREIFTTERHIYAWNEIEKVVYTRVPRSQGFSEYEFFFNDGNSMKLTENGIVKQFRDSLYNRLSSEGLKIEEIRR